MPQLRNVTQPKQARSKKSLLLLLDAAEELITAKGIAEVTITDIVRAAGVSVGCFYGRFRDKDELLLALLERLIRRLDERVTEFEHPDNFRGASLSAIVHVCIRELITVFRGRRALFAAVTARSHYNETMCEVGKDFRTRVIQRFALLMLRQRQQIRHPDPELAAELAAQMVFGLLDQLVWWGELNVASRVLSDEQTEDELVRNVIAYLGASNEQEGGTR